MEITNEAADIINHYLDDVSETIQTIEDAVQLNKEFNNAFDIDAYLHPYRKYKDDDILKNGDVYFGGEKIYDAILYWGFKYFKDKLGGFSRYLTLGYYDYNCRYGNRQLQKVIDMLSTEEQIQLMDDCICKYFIHKFSLDIKI